MSLRLSILGLLVFASSAGAQISIVTHSVSPGDRLRIAYASGTERRHAVGRLVASDSKNQVVLARASGDTAAIDTNLITQVERSIGFERHTGMGALIGAGVGLVFVAVVAATADDDAIVGKEAAVGAAFGVAALTTLLGTAIGAVATSERWQPVHPDALPVRASVTRSQATLTVVFRF
jgi:hypothetical protein